MLKLTKTPGSSPGGVGVSQEESVSPETLATHQPQVKEDHLPPENGELKEVGG
jgi:hypothetical protein